jgi:hypothetical protein
MKKIRLESKEEVWRKINGCDNHYMVSSTGRIKSLRFWKEAGNAKYFTKEKILKTCISKKGYAYIGLYFKGFRKSYSVHRLVAIAFLGKPEQNNLDVNHRNGIKADNRPSNLEWCTRSENELHSYRELGKTGRKGLGRPISCTHKKSRVKLNFKTVIDAMETLSLTKSIYNALLGHRKSYAGYFWKYERTVL